MQGGDAYPAARDNVALPGYMHTEKLPAAYRTTSRASASRTLRGEEKLNNKVDLNHNTSSIYCILSIDSIGCLPTVPLVRRLRGIYTPPFIVNPLITLQGDHQIAD